MLARARRNLFVHAVGVQGADRQLDWQDLHRFRELPLEIAFRQQVEGKSKSQITHHMFMILDIDDDARSVTLQMADVRGNMGTQFSGASFQTPILHSSFVSSACAHELGLVKSMPSRKCLVLVNIMIARV